MIDIVSVVKKLVLMINITTQEGHSVCISACLPLSQNFPPPPSLSVATPNPFTSTTFAATTAAIIYYCNLHLLITTKLQCLPVCLSVMHVGCMIQINSQRHDKNTKTTMICQSIYILFFSLFMLLQ